MEISALDAWFRENLAIGDFAAADPSMNGLQVGSNGAAVTNIAFAVDATLETFEKAASLGAGLLFVHHGLFWGAPGSPAALPVTGSHRQRLAFLLSHNLALYAAHLPLDAHPVLGNNAALADMLGLEDRVPFGAYHGKKIGFRGRFSAPKTAEEIAALFTKNGERGKEPAILPFGKEKCATCAVVSGGAAELVEEAIADGCDMFLTGEVNHAAYHAAREGSVTFIAAGHYATEVFGVQRLAAKIERDLKVETCFIDAPTGL